jgi:hypothetical protein
MVRFKTLAAGIFVLVGMAHVLRIVFAWQVTIGNLAIPMWVSVAGVVVALLLVVLALFENRA